MKKTYAVVFSALLLAGATAQAKKMPARETRYKWQDNEWHLLYAISVERNTQGLPVREVEEIPDYHGDQQTSVTTNSYDGQNRLTESNIETTTTQNGVFVAKTIEKNVFSDFDPVFTNQACSQMSYSLNSDNQWEASGSTIISIERDNNGFITRYSYQK